MNRTDNALQESNLQVISGSSGKMEGNKKGSPVCKGATALASRPLTIYPRLLEITGLASTERTLIGHRFRSAISTGKVPGDFGLLRFVTLVLDLGFGWVGKHIAEMGVILAA